MISLRRTRNQKGVSLVELMAALTIFSIITLGVVPLLASAMKGVNTSRWDSVAENVAKTAMERIRGLRYYVSYESKPNKRVDLLDLYFPQTAGAMLSGQSYQASAANAPISGLGGVFTTACPAADNPACPGDIPDDYSITFKASFVQPVTTTTPQTYAFVNPASDYSWNTQGKDKPPANLMDLSVITSWTAAGRSKSMVLRSIIGERSFTPVAAVDAGPSPSPSASPTTPSALKVQGSAEVDYTYQVSTGFSTNTAQPATGCPTAPCKSELLATIGAGDSLIRTQTLSTASTSVRYATMRLQRTYPPGVTPPDPPPADLASVDGVVHSAYAPPASAPANKTTPASPYTDTFVTHPDFANAQIAKISNSYAYSLAADTASELPYARSSFASIWSTTTTEEWIQNNQTDYTTTFLRLLNGDTANKQVMTMNESAFNPAPTNVGGFTRSTATSLTGGDRKVESIARAEFNSLRLIRYHFSNQVSNYMVHINDFRATATCKATANGGTAIADVSWTADILYFRDLTADNKINPTATILISKATTYSSSNPVADPSAGIGVGAGKTNYLVYDVTGTTSDLWLFNDPANNRKGYLESWSLNTAPVASKSTDGRTTRASMDAAIRINTAPMSPTVPETSYNISVGRLSCESVDNR